MTQTQLADATGLTRSAVASYESGRINTPQDFVRKVAALSGIPVYWFYDGTDAPPIAETNATLTEVAQSPTINLVKYLGTVPAGDWEMPQGEDWDYIQVSDSVNPKDVFAVRVGGNSMSPMLRHGQVVCIKESKHPRDGVITLARSGQGDLTLKVLRMVGGAWCLEPINPEYGSVSAESWEILGYAIHVEENDPAGLRP